jgi:hypothetical protein
MEKARKSCMVSRDAFFPLIAQCSYFFALHHRAGSEDVQEWFKILESDGEIPPSWLDLLKDSVISDMSARRIGVMVDPSYCKWLKAIPTLLRANVPVWFYWGTSDAPITSNNAQVEKYRLSNLDVILWTLSQEGALSSVAPVTHHPSNPSNALDCFPEPERLSGQRKAETWQQFFDRREKRNQEKIKVESATERQLRLARAKNAAPKTRPGKDVYEWQEREGFLIRTRVDRCDIERTWRIYGPTHKKFDAFANEWDLCYEFDPNLNAPTDDDVAFEFESGTPEPTNHLPLPSSSPTPPETAALPASHWHRELSSKYDMAIATNRVALPALDDMLYDRYGFSPDAAPGQNAMDEKEYNMARLILGHPQDNLPRAQRAQFLEFCSRLVEETPPNATLWDHAKYNAAYIHQAASRVRIQVRPCLNGQRLYIIVTEDHGNRDKWVLGTWEAATALQCLRIGKESSIAVATNLLTCGTPFLTLKPLSPRTVALPRPSFTLGWRREGYKPDVKDYAAYVHLRDSFLREPHARAALLKGGIVWRLAVDSLSSADALAGPSQHVLDYGTCVHTEDGDLWDDDLSEDELNLICGVYKVFTGQYHFFFLSSAFSIFCQAKAHRQIFHGGQRLLFGDPVA